MKKFLVYICLLWVSHFSVANTDPKPLLSDIQLHFNNAKIINEYTARIPFKLVDRLIIVDATLKDKKGKFIIDTGSETLILNKAHYKTYPFFRKKNGETSGVLNNLDNPLQQRIKKISLKNFSLENKKSDIIDLSHIEKSKRIKLLGIIGYNILKDYEIFIDFYLNQITLSKIDKSGQKLSKEKYLEKIIDSIDFKLKKHAIVVKGYVNNEKVTFGVDTGAEFNMINKRIGRKVLKHFYPKKRIKLTGASGKKIEVLYGNLNRIHLSKDVYFAPMKTILTNLHNMNQAFGTKLDGILGHDFFAQKRIIINYKKEKLYFINFPIIR